MSLTRQFLREFRPLFRMLEEPFGRQPAYMGAFPHARSLLEDPWFQHSNALRPAVDVSEEGVNYVIEAELPGVKKENVQVRVGDGGQSVTIEGKIVNRRSTTEASQPNASSETGSSGAEITQATEGRPFVLLLFKKAGLPTSHFIGTTTVTSAPESTQISAERSFVGTSTFTRTVWLPRRVDPSNVSAKLSDGVLTVTIPKAQDADSVEVPVQ